MIDSLFAVLSVAALALLLRSALGLSRAADRDPSSEAGALTLALYGALLALLTLALFIALV
ncbi:hypothetical protein QCN29_19520 [Streptomyces sp. HNM0663]|uniref:Uncharacterized protein n=1 Tax=Streptomyces chengmaiensis TaxID=3040919 RepID=A0ABT6HRF9_9ACTN|nr:hypothetical protein [Streptomyces chengmaiensis]MDH2390940.1 hypothetical protein [Streptomyces chengmaiensis]